MFGTRHTKNIKLNCQLGEGQLESADSYHYIRMGPDRHLNYDTCITNTLKKANYKTWLLAKLRYYMTEIMAVKIYNGITLLYFDYGYVINMGGNANLLNK